MTRPAVTAAVSPSTARCEGPKSRNGCGGVMAGRGRAPVRAVREGAPMLRRNRDEIR
jgi:hypothetical protein